MRIPRHGSGVALLLLLALIAGRNVSRVGSVAGCPTGCAAAATRAQGPLRVMVLNVLHGFPRFDDLAARLDHIAAEIQRLDADLVLLQEVPWTPRLGDGVRYLARTTGRNHLSVRDNGNRWLILFDSSLAILSRYPLTDAGALELEPRAALFENRVALRATASTPDGPVRLFVTHLTHGNPEVNRRQTATLAGWVDGSAPALTLVGGDFNARPGSPQIRALSRAWRDAYLAKAGSGPGFTCCVGELTSTRAQLSRRVDYLFLVPTPGIRAAVRDIRRVLVSPFRSPEGWRWASDHAGLLAEIEWRQRTPATGAGATRIGELGARRALP